MHPSLFKYIDRCGIFSLLLIACLAGGCSKDSIVPNLGLLGQSQPYLYADQDWLLVLREHVRSGLVDYQSLSKEREPLDRYYALLSQTGPGITPAQFSSRPQIVAYWVNAFNALVLVAVLQQYPIKTIYDVSLPRLEYEYTFRVDGQLRNLAWIESEILNQSAGDVRALLATSRAALGTPRLTNQPLRASTLERQLNDAAADALDSPNLLTVDHTSQSILVWQLILYRQNDFIKYWKTHRRVQTAFLYDVLLDLASVSERRALQSAVGYTFREIAFDRTLNDLALRPAPAIRPG